MQPEGRSAKCQTKFSRFILHFTLNRDRNEYLLLLFLCKVMFAVPRASDFIRVDLKSEFFFVSAVETNFSSAPVLKQQTFHRVIFCSLFYSHLRMFEFKMFEGKY